MSSTPKTTAVDWLQEKIQSNLSEPMSPKFAELFDRAREMHKIQIEQAYVEGCLDTYGVEAMGIVKSDEYYAEQYYNQTYGKSE
jgi:hypothetical protein